jgi:hypothetical protein
MASLLERAGQLYSRPALPLRAFPRERISTWGRWRGLLDKVFTVLDYAKLAEHLRCWQPLLPPPLRAADSGKTRHWKPSSSDRLSEIAQAIGGKPLPPMKYSEPATEDPAKCTHPAESCRLFATGSARLSVACQLCHLKWESNRVQEATSASSTPAPLPKAKASAKAKAKPAVPLCDCKLPGRMFTVRKAGPTQGRHFYKCPRAACKMFQWDQTEIETLLQTQAPQGPNVMTPLEKLQSETYQGQTRQDLLRQEQQEEEWEEVPMG